MIVRFVSIENCTISIGAVLKPDKCSIYRYSESRQSANVYEIRYKKKKKKRKS